MAWCIHCGGEAVIRPFEYSIDRTVNNTLNNDLIKDLIDLKSFGMSINGVNLFVYNESNESLFLTACKGDEKEDLFVVEFLLASSSFVDVNQKQSVTGYSGLIIASRNGKIDKVKTILHQAGHCITVNQCDNNGWTALFHAVENTYIQIVEVLMKNGADINLRDYKGLTPLMIACGSKNADVHRETIQCIFKNGNAFKYNLTQG